MRFIYPTTTHFVKFALVIAIYISGAYILGAAQIWKDKTRDCSIVVNGVNRNQYCTAVAGGCSACDANSLANGYKNYEDDMLNYSGTIFDGTGSAINPNVSVSVKCLTKADCVTSDFPMKLCGLGPFYRCTVDGGANDSCTHCSSGPWSYEYAITYQYVMGEE